VTLLAVGHGLRDPAGVAVIRALLDRLRPPGAVRPGGRAGPELTEVVCGLRDRGARRIAVASYLLAPGHFHDRLRAVGADLVAPPLGMHDALARLILRRYDEAVTAAVAAETSRARRAVSRAG
jgi:sirohydrochlorin ferrochelatase